MVAILGRRGRRPLLRLKNLAVLPDDVAILGRRGRRPLPVPKRTTGPA